MVVSFELWKFLVDGCALTNQSKGTKHRYTKAEAFFDLLDRQRKAISIDDDGYMDSSVMKLADGWGWMRITAKKFLDKLADMGVVTLTPAANRIVVRLNNILGENARTSQSENDMKPKTDNTSSATLKGGVAR